MKDLIHLIKIATKLDYLGLRKEADLLDSVIRKIAAEGEIENVIEFIPKNTIPKLKSPQKPPAKIINFPEIKTIRSQKEILEDNSIIKLLQMKKKLFNFKNFIKLTEIKRLLDDLIDLHQILLPEKSTESFINALETKNNLKDLIQISSKIISEMLTELSESQIPLEDLELFSIKLNITSENFDPNISMEKK